MLNYTYRTKIEHFRFDENGNLLLWRRKVKHLTPPKTKGGKTIVTIIRKEDNAVIGHGEAVCSLKDNFNYKLGRTIAFGRAIKNFIDN